MPSAPRVQLNFDELFVLKDRFARASDTVNTMFSNITRRMDVLDSTWTGRGREAFFAEMQGEVLPAVQRLISALNQASAELQRSADQGHQAEEAAAAHFRQG
jgi:WXG100 family type VII secretion target